MARGKERNKIGRKRMNGPRQCGESTLMKSYITGFDQKPKGQTYETRKGQIYTKNIVLGENRRKRSLSVALTLVMFQYMDG